MDIVSKLFFLSAEQSSRFYLIDRSGARPQSARTRVRHKYQKNLFFVSRVCVGARSCLLLYFFFLANVKQKSTRACAFHGFSHACVRDEVINVISRSFFIQGEGSFSQRQNAVLSAPKRNDALRKPSDENSKQ